MSKKFYKFALIGLAVLGLAGCNGYYDTGGDDGFYSSSSDSPNRDNDTGGFYGNSATGFVSNAPAHRRRSGGFSGSSSAARDGGFSS